MENLDFRAECFQLFIILSARLERASYAVNNNFNFRAVAFRSAQGGQEP